MECLTVKTVYGVDDTQILDKEMKDRERPSVLQVSV